MKVYMVDCDVNNFRILSPAEKSLIGTEVLQFECKPKLLTWSPPTLYAVDPLEPVADFPYLEIPGALTVEPKPFELVRTHFEMAGEVLDLPFELRVLKVLNILKCVNCLDHDKCNWIAGRSGKRAFPKRDGYIFHPDRFDESSIFKIPETYRSMIYCWERDGDPEAEFKAAVEAHKLTGLKFTLLWQRE